MEQKLDFRSYQSTNLPTNLLHQLGCLLNWELNCIQLIYNPAHLLRLYNFLLEYATLQLDKKNKKWEGSWILLTWPFRVTAVWVPTSIVCSTTCESQSSENKRQTKQLSWGMHNCTKSCQPFLSVQWPDPFHPLSSSHDQQALDLTLLQSKPCSNKIFDQKVQKTFMLRCCCHNFITSVKIMD